jgi:signal transduction histidine kinase
VATKEIVRESMKELRASIANLRSPALERESVDQALDRFAHELGRRANLQVTCEFESDVDRLLVVEVPD